MCTNRNADRINRRMEFILLIIFGIDTVPTLVANHYITHLQRIILPLRNTAAHSGPFTLFEGIFGIANAVVLVDMMVGFYLPVRSSKKKPDIKKMISLGTENCARVK